MVFVSRKFIVAGLTSISAFLFGAEFSLRAGVMRYDVAGPSSIRDFNLEEHFRPSNVYHYSPNDNQVVLDSNGLEVPIPQEVSPTAWISNNYANAWNKAGDIVGASFFHLNHNVGFLFKNGEITYFEPKSPGVSQSAMAINDLDQVVGGSWQNAGNAYLFADGVKTDLGGLSGATFSRANDINNSGIIVGISKRDIPLEKPSNFIKGFVVQDGKMFDLNAVTRGINEWNINEALAVTDDGWIYAAVNKPNPEDRSNPVRDNFWLKPLDPTETDNTSNSQGTTTSGSETTSTGSITNSEMQSTESTTGSSGSSSSSTSTVIDTTSGGFWTTSTNTPSLNDPATNSSGGSVTTPQPVPVPEPATFIIWVSLATLLARKWLRL